MILSPSYSQSVSIVESTGSKSEIANFCIMDDIFASSVSTACTWWICAFVSIRSGSSSCSSHAPNNISLLVILLLISQHLSVSIGSPVGSVTVIGNNFDLSAPTSICASTL